MSFSGNKFIVTDLFIKFSRITLSLILIIVVAQFEKEEFYQLYSESFILSSFISLPILAGFDSFISKKLKQEFLSIYHLLLLISIIIWGSIFWHFNYSFLIGVNGIFFNYFIVSWKVKLDTKYAPRLLLLTLTFIISIPLCIIFEDERYLLISVITSLIGFTYSISSEFHKNYLTEFFQNINELKQFSSQKLIDQGGSQLISLVLVNFLDANTFFISSNFIKISSISHSLIYTKLRDKLFGNSKIIFRYKFKHLVFYFLVLNFTFVLLTLKLNLSYHFGLLFYTFLIVLHLILTTKKDVLFWPHAFPFKELIAFSISFTLFLLMFFLSPTKNHYLGVIVLHTFYLITRNLLLIKIVKN